MRLWILRPIHPWPEKLDVLNCVVIRAKSELVARQLATKVAGDELIDDALCWMHPATSSCFQLQSKGKEQVVIKDYREA